MESALFVTNHPQYAWLPKDAVASQIWRLPKLGDEVQQSADEMRNTLQSTLGAERYTLIDEQLKDGGTDTLRRVLNLDASDKEQELSVWIQDQAGKLTVGFGWGAQNTSFSQGGLALSLFLPEGHPEIPDAVVSEMVLTRNLATALTQPALAWLREQAQTRLGQ